MHFGTASAPTNKGAEIAVSLDWISTIVRGVEPYDLAGALESFVPTNWRECGGGYGYTSSLRGAGSSAVFFTPGREDVHAALPGRWCGSLTRRASRRRLSLLDVLSARATSCDLAGTDTARVAEPSDVAQAIYRGEHVTHARHIHFDQGLATTPGATVYVGAPSSRQQLLVYDKTAESHGRVEGVRWELRARAETADSLVEQLCRSEDWLEVWAGRIVGFVDFRGPRNRRLPWFTAVVGDAKRARAYRPRPVRTMEEVERWLDHSVSPSLAAVVKARGDDLAVVTDLLERGKNRWGPQHLALIAQGRVR